MSGSFVLFFPFVFPGRACVKLLYCSAILLLFRLGSPQFRISVCMLLHRYPFLNEIHVAVNPVCYAVYIDVILRFVTF